MASIHWSEAADGYSDALRALLSSAFEWRRAWLDLSGMDLKTVPPELFQMPFVRGVDLSGNSIKEVPAEVFDRAEPPRLVLLGNPIRASGLAHAHRGQVVIDAATAYRCYMGCDPTRVELVVPAKDANLLAKRLPEMLDWCAHLDRLTLGDWSLVIGQSRKAPSLAMLSVLASLAMFRRLSSLSIRGLGISEVPEGIRRLRGLRSLSIVGVPELTWPHWLGTLRLQHLTLFDNGLRALPAFVSRISTLKELDLSWNQFTEFPHDVLTLRGLERLAIEQNGIPLIPAGILMLRKLKVLDVSANPIAMPPAEICDQGLDAMRDYWRQREQAGVDYLCEAKLIILGEAGAGKTTLARKIQDPDYTPNPSEPSTEGIDILRWQFPTAIRPRDGEAKDQLLQRDFQVNIWDFGGQEIYHATHQFFLTRRSIYVLVCDDRKEDAHFNYWMQVVEMLTDSSPLLIVQNEKQDRGRDIDLPALRHRFGNLREAIATNLATDRGLDTVLKAVRRELEALPHVGEALPTTWKRVREALERDERDFITLNDYLDVCEQHGFTRREDKLQLSGYLHDLGICLHFQDDATLKHTVILKPGWGTAAVYRVLDDPLVKKARGRFTRRDLKRIWWEAQYCDMHDELLRLMMKFQLCYELDGQGNYMAPQLLTVQQPSYDWPTSRSTELRYVYGFMPKGLITRFIVTMNHLITDTSRMWRSGVVIERDGCLAEVMERTDEGESQPFIRVRVTGPDTRALLGIVDERLEQLHQSFPRLRCDRQLPCPCAHCVRSDKPFRFTLQILEPAAQQGKEIQCHHSLDMVNAAALLRDVLPNAMQRDARHRVASGDDIGPPVVAPLAPVNRDVCLSYHAGDATEVLVAGLHGALADQEVRLFDYKKDVSFRQSVSEVMARIGKAGCVVLLISREYLRSHYCMSELLQIAKERALRARVFPIVLPDAGLYDPVELADHVYFWEQKQTELDGKLKTISGKKVRDLQDMLNLYADIRDLFVDLTSTLADMNALTVDQHMASDFKALVEGVLARLRS